MRDIPSIQYEPPVSVTAEKTERFYLGMDVGSVSSDVVVMNPALEVVYSDYHRTCGKPLETLREQLETVLARFPKPNLTAVATGTAGRRAAEILDITFINEVIAQASAIAWLYPDLEQATVIDMGGQDSKLIFLARENGHLGLRDFALNSACAAGTGAFLDQQAERLGIEIEQFGPLSMHSHTVPRMAGRCSVFAKSDMIHLQQQATPMGDILAGLCMALARGLKSNLGAGRTFFKPILFTGGVAANRGVVRAFEEVFELPAGGVIVPGQHFFTGAMGAVLAARSKDSLSIGMLRIDKLEHQLAGQEVMNNAPCRPPLAQPRLPVPASVVHEELVSERNEPIDAYLGVDVGSISTNVAVMDSQQRVLSKEYLMTAGNPLRAVREGLVNTIRKVGNKVRILAAATTGSGRYLTGDFIGADIVINEITAQARGARIVCPEVDTIFEIGGQDSKFISLENGVVVDFEMNHACAAGTGSFLEEQAQRLGISIRDEFSQLAFSSKHPLKLGERCTVFIESDLLAWQQQGAAKEDLVAALSYSIVNNYLNRVVGRRRIGKTICFQGGTAFNRAVVAAFEQVTGKAIRVPDHHEVTGALGAAAVAMEHHRFQVEQGISFASRFRGFENLTETDYEVDTFTCRSCSNECQIKRIRMAGVQPLFYGSRCDRYNVVRRQQEAVSFDAFAWRNERMLAHAGLIGSNPQGGKATVGIPRALATWYLLPMFATFLRELGLDVVLSEPTSNATIQRGIEQVPAQPCYPVKVAYGHCAELLERKVDYLLVPSIASMNRLFEDNDFNQLCPFVQSFGFQIQSAMGDQLGGVKLLTTPMYLGDGERPMMQSFVRLAAELNRPARLARKAMRKALAAQADFEKELRDKGREMLASLSPNQKLFVLVSRPYNGCDPGMNLQLPRKLADLGAMLVPLEFLDLQSARLSNRSLHQQVYWGSAQKILRSAEILKSDPRLFGIYLSNFSCGPDSFMQSFFKDCLQGKPSLFLELDEHSADAGLVTRLEAFLDSLRHYQSTEPKSQRIDPSSETLSIRDRRIYVPYMGDCAHGLSAGFRAFGCASEVMSLADEKTLSYGRQCTTGKECLPCAITIGDMMSLARRPDFKPVRSMFFMPGASGPCRFGMYHCLQRLVLDQAGLQDVAILAPNQDSRFYQEFSRHVDGAGGLKFISYVWTGAVGADLLHKVLLHLRPSAKNPEYVNERYRHYLDGWVWRIERRQGLGDLKKYMADVAEGLAAIDRNGHVLIPRVAVVGEIYVRNHPFANNHIIRRLESLGLQCSLSPASEWIYYTNATRKYFSLRRHQFRRMFGNWIQDKVMRRIEHALAEPLEKRFGPLAEEPSEHLLRLAKPYLDPCFEGEAILSVGKMIEAYHKGFDGVVNVMPFGCMPSTIVASMTTRISRDCGGMPILNLSFDGQEDPALTTRLEAFSEQLRRRGKVNRERDGVGKHVAEATEQGR